MMAVKLLDDGAEACPKLGLVLVKLVGATAANRDARRDLLEAP
jgi:hypothetical protein